MRFIAIMRLCGGLLSCLLVLPGCSTVLNNGGTGSGGSGAIKARGVYTTLAMPGRHLDLPASGYLSYRTFGPGQTPAAVVVGYGDNETHVNYGQTYELRLMESASGTVLQTFNSQAYGDMADVVDLPIRKSGKYQLQLALGGSVADTWDFTVIRETPADSGSGGPPAAYARGDFSVGMTDFQSPDAFKEYDDSLLWALNVAIPKELEEANRDDFAQLAPGHVAIQFCLHANGQVTAPQILENTLSDALGEFFLRVLQRGVPYQAWSAETRAALASETRTMKITFYYN
jgi:hypothetical protein